MGLLFIWEGIDASVRMLRAFMIRSRAGKCSGTSTYVIN